METPSICEKYGAKPVACDGMEKLGIALVTIGKQPINGVRYEAENGTCGWYIWCGEELSEDTDFFKPLHVNHIEEYLPEIEPYLSLPPGYRFLIAPGQEDVWFDSSLIGK